MNRLTIQFLNSINKPRNWLLLANALLVFFLILLGNTDTLPLKTGDFIFFSALFLAFALYRPGWAFLLFIGLIPLENISLLPESWGFSARPYQFAGALTIIAVLVRLAAGKLSAVPKKLKLPDYLVLLATLGGFISAFAGLYFSLENQAAPSASFKLAFIFATFAALYFLVRYYIQNIDDLKKIIPFFLSSSVIVVLYGVWQNIRFLEGAPHFESMPGRPNATFAEPDWLGIFLILVVCAVYALVYLVHLIQKSVQASDLNRNGSALCDDKNCTTRLFGIKGVLLFLFLTFYLLLLVLTVSRSAWLGVFSATFIFLFIVFTNLKFNSKNWRFKELMRIKIFIFSSFLVSIILIYVFNLTNFQLGNRVQSTGSGLQKITISCLKNPELISWSFQELSSGKSSIINTAELSQFGCRHINLEEIEAEKEKGNFVSEIFRKDPSIGVRSQTYEKTWKAIKKHFFSGIGWGNVGLLLGKDENGNYLNSSNVFLEVWMGAGLVGFVSFLTLFLHILLKAIKNYHFSANLKEKAFNLFVVSSWFGLIVSNLFNAGIFLGFLWAWLAVASCEIKKPQRD